MSGIIKLTKDNKLIILTAFELVEQLPLAWLASSVHPSEVQPLAPWVAYLAMQNH